MPARADAARRLRVELEMPGQGRCPLSALPAEDQTKMEEGAGVARSRAAFRDHLESLCS